MPQTFAEAYQQLNRAQRSAVDTTEGPLLVLAGPGTGKTQLLSTRAAKIVAGGNASPSNILCLTYTEGGASEMRQRLTRLMGNAGSEISVYTFHGFGSWLISQYPQHFSQERSLKPLDDLGRYALFQSLLQKLPFRHQLAIRDDQEHFIRQHAVEEAVRACKEAGLSPSDLRNILADNQHAYQAIQPLLDELFGSTLSAKRLPAIRDLVGEYQASLDSPYAQLLLTSLSEAINAAEASGKTVAIGDWRTAHTRISGGKRVLKSALDHELLKDLANLYEQYQSALQSTGKFDYEDMILWATSALQTQQDMLLDVAERFQYVMVDEYQDTNGAQNKLLDTLLNANPLDSPNVMVVGDDDQAIMRFQGAELSGMFRFIETYQPTIISLEENYRSNQPILDAAATVIQQSNERLVAQDALTGITKQLHSQRVTDATPLTLTTYQSPHAEYHAVANEIAALIEQGVPPREIGVIGRKHATLAEFVPYLTTKGILIAYDRRENILETTAINQLLRLARYLDQLATKPTRAEALLPVLLSDDYWQIPELDVYRIASTARSTACSWLDTMLAGNQRQQECAEWLIAAAGATHTNNFTQLFDILIGRQALETTKLKVSPFKHTYEAQPSVVYATILSHLIRLRQAVLETNPRAQTLADLLNVCKQYLQSGIRLVDDSPLLRGNSEGVQVVSAHGSKGREFEHVFVLSCTDEQWGTRARSNNQRIRLPENLPLYPAGDTVDDKLRLLYVAMTRAKNNLHLSTHLQSEDGRSRTPLSLLQSTLSSSPWEQILKEETIDSKDTVDTLATQWHPHEPVNQQTLAEVLLPLTENYRLSPTALRDFLDICYAGPQACIERHILKFPSSYNAHSALGSATHKTLQLAHAALSSGSPLTQSQLLETFDAALDASNLSPEELTPARNHAHAFLPAFIGYYGADLAQITQTEQFLRGESPTYNTPLSGVIDAIATSKDGIRIIDYKTGKPPLPDWKTTGLSDSKKLGLHFYRQQLLFYALLAPASKQFKQAISSAELVFVEESGDPENPFIRLRIDQFTPEELARTEKLMTAVHRRITTVNLPETSIYPATLKGVIEFEESLIAEL